MADKKLLFLLDESGSMIDNADQIVDSINRAIETQRNLMTENVEIELIKFNNVVSEPLTGDLRSYHFDENDYNPEGQTALYDAIGKTITKYSDKKGYVMIIATDGRNNLNGDYTLTNVKEMINRMRNVNNWKFIYLADNIESLTEGKSMGLDSMGGTCQSVSSSMSSSEFHQQLYSSLSQ